MANSELHPIRKGGAVKESTTNLKQASYRINKKKRGLVMALF